MHNSQMYISHVGKSTSKLDTDQLDSAQCDRNLITPFEPSWFRRIIFSQIGWGHLENTQTNKILQNDFFRTGWRHPDKIKTNQILQNNDFSELGDAIRNKPKPAILWNNDFSELGDAIRNKSNFQTIQILRNKVFSGLGDAIRNKSKPARFRGIIIFPS